jgi:hypothetical protein
MLESEIDDWCDNVIASEKQSVMKKTTAFLTEREVREARSRSLRATVVSFKKKAQGRLINFAGLKRDKSTVDVPTETKHKGLAKLLMAYPIACSIAKNLTTKDLLNLAAAVPSVMWADTKEVLEIPPKPHDLKMEADVETVFPSQMRAMFAASRALIGTRIPHPKVFRRLEVEFLEDLFTKIIPEFVTRLEDLETKRYCFDWAEPTFEEYSGAYRHNKEVLRSFHKYRSELRDFDETMQTVIPAAFGWYKPPSKILSWVPSDRHHCPPKVPTARHHCPQKIPTRPRSASLPDRFREKPNISTRLPELERLDVATSNSPNEGPPSLLDFRTMKRIMTDQLNHRRLNDLLVGVRGPATVAPQVYRLQDRALSAHRRYQARCKCKVAGWRTCFYHGLRLSAKAEQPDFWTKFWFEVPHPMVVDPEYPIVNVSEAEIECLLQLYPSWTREARQRVEEIVTARLDASRRGVIPLWTPDTQEPTPYWESLQIHSSECACCGLSKPKFDAQFEKICDLLGKAVSGEVQVHHMLQDAAAKHLDDYLGTMECWGCHEMFCNVSLVFLWSLEPADVDK